MIGRKEGDEMDFNEIKPNTRIQLKCEHEEIEKRNMNGIVLRIDPTDLLIVTDFGDLVHVDLDSILSIEKTSFDRRVSDALNELKEYYEEIYQLTSRLNNLKQQQPAMIEKLVDAEFLSKFNIRGAKIRLDHSIEKKLLSFEKDPLQIKIQFGWNPNEQIELMIYAYNQFEYYNLDEIGAVDKIIRIHAPAIKELIEKSFSFPCPIEEMEKKVVHEKESLYYVLTTYRIKIDVNVDNFLAIRDAIRNGLINMRK